MKGLLTRENYETSGMTKNRFVLDTNAVIYITTKGNTISSGLQNDLNDAELFISVITEIELFAMTSIPLHEEEKLRSFISDMLSVIDLTSDVKHETIKIRRTTKLKLPDSIVAASAAVNNAVLLTADTQLLRLSWFGLQVQNLM